MKWNHKHWFYLLQKDLILVVTQSAWHNWKRNSQVFKKKQASTEEHFGIRNIVWSTMKMLSQLKIVPEKHWTYLKTLLQCKHTLKWCYMFLQKAFIRLTHQRLMSREGIMKRRRNELLNWKVAKGQKTKESDKWKFRAENYFSFDIGTKKN